MPIVERAIGTANVTLQQMVGAANYATLSALATTAPEISGGTVDGELFEGLVVLVSEYVFGLLADENTVITGFGTVEKVDEFSRQADFFEQCKFKEAHFREGVQHLCRIKKWHYTEPSTSRYTTKFFTDGTKGHHN